MQFAAAGDLKGVLLGGFGHLDRHIAFGFAQQALADHARLNLVAFLAGQRAVIDRHGHGDGRRIDRLGGQGVQHFDGAQGVGHGGLAQACNGDDVAGFGHLDRLALQAAEGQDLGDPAPFDFLAVARQGVDGLARREAARFHAARQQTAEEGIVFDQHGQDLGRLLGAGHCLGLGHVLDDLIEDGGQGFLRVAHIDHRPALLA